MAREEAIATFEGEPLLGEAGMKDIGLLQDPQTVNRSKLAYNGMSVGEITEEEGVDPVYIVALNAVLNAERSRGLSLAKTSILKMADTTGRSMVAVDRMLKASEEAQPIVLLERGIKGYRFDANVFVGVTRPGEGLEPTISKVQQITYSGAQRYIGDRDSWAVPMNPGRTGVFRIADSETSFGPDDPILSLLVDDEKVAPGLHTDVAHAFELIPEQGNASWAVEPRRTIKFDEDGGIVEVKAALETEHHLVDIAIGQTSVEQALQELHKEYIKHSRIDKAVDEPGRMFDLLTQFALGEAGVPPRPYMIPAPAA